MHKSQKAFSLMEVMISMAIFIIGMVAVAAIFPTAALLQRNTLVDVFTQQIAANAEATILGMEIDENDLLAAGAVADGKVHHLPNLISEGDRTYPPTINEVYDRDYEWYTLAKKDPTHNFWLVYVMITRLTGDHPTDPTNLTIPLSERAVRPIPRQVDVEPPDDGGLSKLKITRDILHPELYHLFPGDWIIDLEGTIHKIIHVTYEKDDPVDINSPVVEIETTSIFAIQPTAIWIYNQDRDANPKNVAGECTRITLLVIQ